MDAASLYGRPVAGRRAGARRRLAGALALLFALTAISGASAQADGADHKLLIPPGFTLKASNGYSIFVVAAPASKGRPATVIVVASGKRRGVTYFAPATVTESSIQADLGDLGEIAVTFRPSGRARSEHSVCNRRPVSFDSGFYEGMIKLNGEEGYTRVEATRAQGDIQFLLDFICPGISGGRGGPFMPGAELDVDARGAQFGPYMKVVKNRPSAAAHFEVGIFEKREGIAIERFASPIAPASAFRFDPKVQTATVHPPAPFSGTAQFHRNATPANRWSGDLTVDLPGKSDVSLTEDNLQARLAHAKWDFTP
jgi:hypothetical protein